MLQGLFLAIALIFVLVLGLQKLFDWLILPSHIYNKCQDYLKPCRLITNIAIGLSVLGILTIFQAYYPWMMDAEDASFDFAMQVRQDTIPHAKDIPPFVFLDIDDQTYKLWGEPLFTPRDKVKQLIEVAVKGGARLVIVDIDLSQETPIDGLPLNGLQQHPYDKALYDYIANYKNNCQGCPPIILERAFRPLPKSLADGKKLIVEPRTGFLEKAVSDSAPYIQWASPLFKPSSYDGAVRRWGLGQSICTAEEKPDIIPSTQLLAAAMIHHETPQLVADKINFELDRFKQKNCGDSYIPQSSKPIKIAEGLEITGGIYGINQRIVYNMPWISYQGIAEKWMLRYSLRDYDKETQKSGVILTVFSAQPYLESPEGSTFRDKIVVIGSSYSDGGNLHSTPLGTMPGGLVIINALHSLLQYEKMEPSFAWNKGWAVLLIVVVSLLLTFVESFWLMFLSGIVIILLVPVSAFLFVEGVWINFVLPLLVIYIHQMLIRFNKITKNVESQQKKSAKLERKIRKSVEESLTKQIKQLVAKLDLENLIKQSIEQSNEKEADSETGAEKSKSLQWLKKQGNELYQWIKKWIKKLFSYLLPSRKNLIINLFLGLGVAFLLLYFNNNPWIMEAEDASMDWFMKLNRNIVPSIQKNDIPPVVILDIDDKTFQAWGEPLVIEQDRIISMIDTAIKGKPRLILISFDVNRTLPFEGNSLHPHNKVLKEYLANYVTKCKEQRHQLNCPPIILLRQFEAYSNLVQTPRTGFLDDLVAQSAPYLQWASGQFSEQVVRRWKLWQPVCTSDKQPMVVPSIELLAMSFVKEDCITQDVQNTLQLFQPKNCDNESVQPLHENFKLCGLPINTKDRWDINQRIFYRMGWLTNGKQPKLPYEVLDLSGKPALKILSAQADEKSENLKYINNSVVVLGASHHEGGGIFSTPLGDMPDALIMINAWHSLLQNDKIKPHPIMEVLITMVLIVILSAFFVRFSSVTGKLIWGVIIIFGLLPLFIIILLYGIWFNLALPLIVITVYQVWNSYNQLLQIKNPVSSTSDATVKPLAN